MAKLVAVCRSDDYPFERRQIPLVVDENLTMVMQFSDSCIRCEQGGLKQKEMEKFVQRFHALSKDEAAGALMVTNSQITNLLAQMVPCVGCRRSVERLFDQLVKSGHPALEPLVISRSAFLSLKRDYLYDPKLIYALFYVHGTRLNTVMESIPKSKKNKRCMLHSLDTHKTKSLGSWIDIWDVLSKECREEVILVDSDCLMDTLENYLRKHRFCSECKAKVLRAYNILVGDVDHTSEKGYCPALYDGLKCCPGEKHIHVSCETDFMAHLIGRAEPELTGSRRERHAKTLDIAQEEVLTCLGIYLYDRLHRIWQKLRAEEQTWQILFYLGVDALKKSFEMALERKQGISNLELMCQELLEEEQAKEQRKEQKRQKRKKKKNKSKPDNTDLLDKDDKENCKCDENTNVTSAMCAACDDHLVALESRGQHCRCGQERAAVRDTGGTGGNRSDCGYSSGHDGCESCSVPSSRDGSDIACSDGMCNHDAECGDSPLCNRMEIVDVCRDCHQTSCNGSPTHYPAKRICDANGAVDLGSGEYMYSDGATTAKYSMQLSLQDMLEASCSSGEEEGDGISEEEIQRFKANQKTLDSQRQELRQTLRQRFANMQQRQCHNGPPLDTVTTNITKLSMN